MNAARPCDLTFMTAHDRLSDRAPALPLSDHHFLNFISRSRFNVILRGRSNVKKRRFVRSKRSLLYFQTTSEMKKRFRAHGESFRAIREDR